jgi:RNA polymerase sigma factor (sigma-70 family)
MAGVQGLKTAQKLAPVIPIEAHRAAALAKRDALVEANLDLVPAIARRIAAKLPPSIDLDDLIATGNMALVYAANCYRPSQHADTPFSAYARQIIRGRMLDSIRRRHYDHATRPGLASVPEPSLTQPIEINIDQARLKQRVSEAVAQLEPRDQKLLGLYYGPAEPDLATVAKVLDISRIRTKQLHSRAIASIARRLKSAV